MSVTLDSISGVPSRPHAAARENARAQPHDWLAEGILVSQIIGATFLQKIAVPVGGTQLYLGLFVILGAVAVGVLTQRLEIHGPRLALYALMAGGAALTQLAGGRDFSVLSLGLLLVMHFPYAFRLREGLARPGIEIDFFRKVVLALAIIGIAQYAAQFAVGWQDAFYLDAEAPKNFIVQGFHGLNPVGRAGHVFKSNGFFLLEPAIFSQILALGVIVELIYFGSWGRILVYLAGILVSFSGTGIVILGLLVPVLLAQKRQYLLLAVLFLIAATALFGVPLAGVEQLSGRVAEFANPHTSAYARFLSTFVTLHDYLLTGAGELFFGMGAGTMKNIALHANYATHDPSWGKILFEYGVVGAALYAPLMLHVFLGSPRSPYLRATLMIQFLFLGEYILTPTVHGLLLALLAWPCVDHLQKQGMGRAVRRSP